MLTNDSCTLYHAADGGYLRIPISACFWQGGASGFAQKGGYTDTAETVVYIPAEHVPDVPLQPAKDMLVRGDCPFVFDNTDDKTVSQGMAELRAAYAYVTVTAALDRLHAPTLSHMKVVCR